MPIKIKYIPPTKSTSERIAGSAIGTPFRVASKVATMPLGMSDFFTNLVASKYRGTPEEARLNDYFEKTYGTKKGTEPVDSEKFFREKILSPLIGKFLPEGALESTTPQEKFIDNVLAGAATLPLYGSQVATGAMPYLGQALKSLPAAFGEETGRNIMEGAGFGAIGQLLGGAGGLLAGQGITGLGKNLLENFPGVATKFGKKQLERRVPLVKEYGQIFSKEQKDILKKQRESMRTEGVTQKDLERFRNENLTTRQEELDSLKLLKTEKEAKISEAERIRAELKKYNAENIGEESSLDKDVLARRELNQKQIDKFQAENNDIMSKEDARALKQKIERGERLTFQDMLSKETNELTKQIKNISSDITDVKTFEQMAMEKFGALPSEVKQRINNVFQDFRETIPENAKVSDSKIEAVNKHLEDIFGNQKWETTSESFGRKIIEKNRAISKNGEINVRDLADLPAKINEEIGQLKASKGELIRFERLMSKKFIPAVEETMNMAKSKYPILRTDLWNEGRRLTRDIKQTQDASRWISKTAVGTGLKYLDSFLNNPSLVLTSPEIRRYVKRAGSDYLKQDLTQASKNLVVADKLIERKINKEQKLNSIKAFKVPPKGKITKVTF